MTQFTRNKKGTPFGVPFLFKQTTNGN